MDEDDEYCDYYERSRTYQSGVATGVFISAVVAVAIIAFVGAFLLMV